MIGPKQIGFLWFDCDGSLLRVRGLESSCCDLTNASANVQSIVCSTRPKANSTLTFEYDSLSGTEPVCADAMTPNSARSNIKQSNMGSKE